MPPSGEEVDKSVAENRDSLSGKELIFAGADSLSSSGIETVSSVFFFSIFFSNAELFGAAARTLFPARMALIRSALKGVSGTDRESAFAKGLS